MATIVIDQKRYEVSQQRNLLETAISLGLDLPYFCWHPALGSVGSCRQCAVLQFADDKDQQGRLVMACMTPVKDGMHFSIDHETCASFRKNIIEWLMINHPHDCPVCDEGGECHLQDMTVMAGHNHRRHRFLKRTFENQDLGPFINHEMNRCITCYRCVRYYKDVAGGTDLSAFKSSGKVYFGRFENGCLGSEFSGNLVEVCPTGVFTDKVFHKRYVRKWDLKTAPSICQLCSVGCNISPAERGGILRRVQNRYHPQINGYFICDLGRFGHEFVNADERVKTPFRKEGLAFHKVSFEEAHLHLTDLLRASSSTIGIGSPRASLEANWVLKKWVGAANFYDGLSAAQNAFMNAATGVLHKNTITVASLADIRDSDCVIILGEDVTNSAPMMALSCRQAALSLKQRISEKDLGISRWNDASVRDYARLVHLPIFIIHPYATGLDDIATSKAIAHPFDIASVARSLLQAVKNEAWDRTSLREELLSFVDQAKRALLLAKCPVIIVGGSLGQPILTEIAHQICASLDPKNLDHTRLAMVASDANSVGLSLLHPKPVISLLEEDVSIDLAIVLENDLKSRLGETPFHKFSERVKNLIVIDSLFTETAKHAGMVFPCLTFAESTGSMVSGEGRLQRYVSVFPSKLTEVQSSFHFLVSCMDALKKEQWQTIDDVNHAMAEDIDGFSHAFDGFKKANFKILGRGLPRETSEASGRTAMNADVSVHERGPTIDVDSPYTYSMEGYRNKIPLPLLSTYWEPAWNSVQASFKKELEDTRNSRHQFGGMRLFGKKRNSLIEPSKQFTMPLQNRVLAPRFHIYPRHYIFSLSEQTRFSASITSRIKGIFATISEMDAAVLGFTKEFEADLLANGKNYRFLVQSASLPDGVLLLPYGLVDASLFFQIGELKPASSETI